MLTRLHTRLTLHFLFSINQLISVAGWADPSNERHWRPETRSGARQLRKMTMPFQCLTQSGVNRFELHSEHKLCLTITVLLLNIFVICCHYIEI